MYSLGRKLRDLRNKKGWTQDELVDKMNRQFNININKSMISKWENGSSEPTLENARYLVQIFNISLDELLGINEPDTIAAHHNGEEWTEEELAEIDQFKKFVRMKRQKEN
ncbi:helix-turn-helix domain-containing protein [Paenibacillus paeoniae]|uniref:helix-turn-helix domain-containing protein n=1 Tax=Paenibacillus paeoniae TaxID=2292705 RepID=UPI0023E7A1A3|nr:helix-turn-helix transcriptional regulator [Paenibacillus paeoniae]